MTDKPPTAEGSASPQARSDLMTPTAAATALADLSNMLESATTLFEVNTIQQKAEAQTHIAGGPCQRTVAKPILCVALEKYVADGGDAP
jgi:hypothetical protein